MSKINFVIKNCEKPAGSIIFLDPDPAKLVDPIEFSSQS